MSNTNIKYNTRNGYTADEGGFSGAFSWWRSPLFPGKWLVMSVEFSFVKDTLVMAVTDDFGNLVRVPS